MAMNRVGQKAIIEIVTSTVTGVLRKEIEHYLQETVIRDNIARETIPWAQIRAHVVS